MAIAIVIPGKPVGKGRPRFSMANGFARSYTPPKTVEYENLVRLAWMQAGHEKMEGPIEVIIQASFQIPKGTSKKRAAEMDGKVYPHKPDCDNIAKVILDALNGIAYDDDGQVVSLTVEKRYREKGPQVKAIFCPLY